MADATATDGGLSEYHAQTIRTMVQAVMTENQAAFDKRAALVNRVYVALGLLIFLLAGGLIAMWSLQQSLIGTVEGIKAEQERVAANENAYKLGAQQCANAIATGAQLGDFCSNPIVLKYYDPNQIPQIPSSSQAQVNHDMLCRIAVKLEIYEPSCVSGT